MDDLHAIFEDVGFLIALGLVCSVLVITGLVIWYVQTYSELIFDMGRRLVLAGGQENKEASKDT
jgi:hypothetical protein